MATDEGGQSENGGRLAAVFPDGRCPTTGGASMARRGVAGSAQEKTGSESINCPESDKKRPLYCTVHTKQSHANGQDLRRLIPRTITNEDEFTANLYIHLHEEARYQESLDENFERRGIRQRSINQ